MAAVKRANKNLYGLIKFQNTVFFFFKAEILNVKVVSFHCCRPAFLSMLMREAVILIPPRLPVLP